MVVGINVWCRNIRELLHTACFIQRDAENEILLIRSNFWASSMILNTKNKEKSFLYILCERPSRKTLKDNTIINNAVKGTSLVIQAVSVWEPKLEEVQFNSTSLLINYLIWWCCVMCQ